MLSNPLVLFSGIINTRYTDPNIDVLKKQGAVDLNFVTEVVRRLNYAQIKGGHVHGCQKYWSTK